MRNTRRGVIQRFYQQFASRQIWKVGGRHDRESVVWFFDQNDLACCIEPIDILALECLMGKNQTLLRLVQAMA